MPEGQDLQCGGEPWNRELVQYWILPKERHPVPPAIGADDGSSTTLSTVLTFRGARRSKDWSSQQKLLQMQPSKREGKPSSQTVRMRDKHVAWGACTEKPCSTPLPLARERELVT
ncbi:hypothetical protein KIL84_014325 [Mauremys mutica]|uniref:Uncharacterized protein n=1 Tax=Mauremys mutica TaxID=74926 RepID=A0A9D3XN85_9SAUR|nr:hypothetical protein KIL84_014325 [Mauremys mutica]